MSRLVRSTLSNPRRWPYPGSVVDFDFIAGGRLFFDGRQIRPGSSDFSSWSGVTQVQDGGVVTSAAKGIKIPLGTLFSTPRGTIMASWISTLDPIGANEIFAELWNGTANEAVRLTHTSSSTEQAQVRAGGVAVLSFSRSTSVGRIRSAVLRFDTDNHAVYFDGTGATNTATGARPSALTELGLGAPSTRLHRFVALPFLLTDEALRAYSQFSVGGGI